MKIMSLVPDSVHLAYLHSQNLKACAYAQSYERQCRSGEWSARDFAQRRTASTRL